MIYNGDDENTLEAIEGVALRKISFGLSGGCNYTAANLHTEPGSHSEFDLMNKGSVIAHVKLKVPGRHNILNALAAAAAALLAGVPASAVEKG